MQRISVLSLAIVALVWTPTTVDELVRREQVRRSVDEATAMAQTRTDSRESQDDLFLAATTKLLEIGAETIPFLEEGLQSGDPEAAYFSVYALGRIGGDDARRVLVEEIDRAEGQTGDAAMFRKGWACYALALTGDPLALERVDRGTHSAGKVSIHDGVSALEAIAIQLGDAALPLLLQQLEQPGGARPLKRMFVLKALNQLHHTDAIPVFATHLGDEIPALRRQAGIALGRFDTPETRALMVGMLDDAVPAVRLAAAEALAEGTAQDVLEPLAARLETEEDTPVRGAIYRALAYNGGTAMTDRLLSAWGRPDPFDRAALVQLLPLLDRKRAFDTLRVALNDENIQVSVAAAHALESLDDGKADRLLLEALGAGAWNLSKTALDILVAKRESSAGRAIAQRLIDVELAGVVTDPRAFMRIEALADGLVALGAVGRLPDLARAHQRQIDPTLIRELERRVDELKALGANGNDAKRWIEATKSSAPGIRTLAYRTLGRLGGEANAGALVLRFARVPIDEGVEILRVLGDTDADVAEKLLRRVLTSPEFDSVEHRPLRDVAAWSARRIGSRAMLEALTESVQRRGGRDFRPLVYLGVLGGERALPLLERYGHERLRAFGWERGNEKRLLDRLIRRIRLDRDVSAFDRPPQRLHV